MFKAIFLSIFSFLSFFNFQSKAQSSSNIGLNVEIGLPSGNFANVSPIGLGGSIKADIKISDVIAISLNAGIINFFGKNNRIVSSPDLTYIPVKGGMKYYLAEGFYLEGQLGSAIPLDESRKASFVWSPGIGNMFRLKNKNKIDLGFRYEAWIAHNENPALINSLNTAGFVGLRLGYVFGL